MDRTLLVSCGYISATSSYGPLQPSLVSVPRAIEDRLVVTCVRCGKPAALAGLMTKPDTLETQVVVKCHGEYAELTVPDRKLVKPGAIRLEAFVAAPLPPLRPTRRITLEE